MNTSLTTLEQRIIALKAQLATLNVQLSSSTQGTRLIAPVEVFTVEGQLILTIDKQVHKTHITLHNTNGYPVATLGIDGSEAGYLSIRNVEGVLVAYLDVETAGARLILQDHEQNGGVVLFGGDSGDNHGGGMNIIHTTGGISIALL